MGIGMPKICKPSFLELKPSEPNDHNTCMFVYMLDQLKNDQGYVYNLRICNMQHPDLASPIWSHA